MTKLRGCEWSWLSVKNMSSNHGTKITYRMPSVLFERMNGGFLRNLQYLLAYTGWYPFLAPPYILLTRPWLPANMHGDTTNMALDTPSMAAPFLSWQPRLDIHWLPHWWTMMDWFNFSQQHLTDHHSSVVIAFWISTMCDFYPPIWSMLCELHSVIKPNLFNDWY